MIAYHWLEHEKRQSNAIQMRSSRVDDLQGELQDQKQKVLELTETVENLEQDTAVSWLDEGVNYLAIGNSITSHALASYWWNDGVGMAASSEDKDYVHQIGQWLEANYKEPVETYSYNFYAWEAQSADRAEALQQLNPYLSSRLGLITIQLGENVSSTSTFANDLEDLCKYLAQRAPNAQIIMIDDFWDDGEKSQIKKEVAQACGIAFVSLSEIKGDKEYQAGLGTTVYDRDGHEHVIEHSGVASHPGDKGMTYIAEAIEKAIMIEFH